jgi:hypothetical protein
MLDAPHHDSAIPTSSSHLRSFWLESEGAVFAELPPQQQWYLHDYFLPDEQLSDTELLAHRKVISRQRPSLRQSAAGP